jgi:hypothetical protein
VPGVRADAWLVRTEKLTFDFMKLSEFKQLLGGHPTRNVRFELPTGTRIPAHSHVTDVARNEKHFVDCGGEFRKEITCRLQTWYADDTEHRISAATLMKILNKAATVLQTDDLEMEVEHEAPFISHFPVDSVSVEEEIVVRLGIKRTACLAADACGIPQPKKKPIQFRPLASLTPNKCCS